MPNRPFRFLHAGDFHLEMPPHGVAEVPEHLTDLFLEAPYAAAEQVFETALAESVAFVVLSGDLLNPQLTGPRGPLFLVEQFARLAEHDIPVYWAGGGIDPPEAWPPAMRLPDNVYRFPVGRVESFTVQRDGLPLASIQGISRDTRQSIRAAEFSPAPGGLVSLAVVHGAGDPESLKQRSLHYWALGGRHDRGTPLSGPTIVHWPGTPQGRRPSESGMHGCTVVHVDEQGRLRTNLVTTDVLRWLNERLVVDEATGRDALETQLRERMHTLVETNPNIDLAISWAVAGTGPLLGKLRRGPLAAELLGWLRGEYGHGSPAAWSLAIDAEPSLALPPEWFEQETIRADFLRAIRQYETDIDQALDLGAYLPESELAEVLGPGIALNDKQARRKVLHEAALLGVDLLTGEELLS